jgi:DNA invertase Pin-like site-specific DNA recombinase
MDKHTAIYARVSTKAQDAKSQRPDLERHAAAVEGDVRWYDDKFTGKSMDRPGWNKLEAAIRGGQVSAVVVWRLDRLGRTASGLTKLFDELIARKVNLVSMKEGIDLSTPAGRMMANVIAAIAQYETEIRGERVLAGQAVARAKGRRWGGSVKGRRRKVKPEQVQAIHHLHAAGTPIARIARAVGLSRQCVYSVLDEPAAVAEMTA